MFSKVRQIMMEYRGVIQERFQQVRFIRIIILGKECANSASVDENSIINQILVPSNAILERLILASATYSYSRTSAMNPKLLLLDEPLAGLNHVEAARLADTVAGINREGMTVVMIEHNLGEILRVSQRLVVLDNGYKIADGHPEEVMRDQAVRNAYVGKEKKDATS